MISRKADKAKHIRRIRAGVLAGILACATLHMTSCGKTAAAEEPIDASAVSFDATVYYARDGRLRFLYDDETDMLAAMEGYDMVSLYAGGTYSMVLSYREGTLTRGEADAYVEAEFNSGDGTIALRGASKSVDVSGHPFRRAEITCADGSTGAVLYGSTDTGFAELYYILAPDAAETDRTHVEEILATVKLAEFSDTDEDDVRIYVE